MQHFKVTLLSSDKSSTKVQKTKREIYLDFRLSDHPNLMNGAYSPRSIRSKVNLSVMRTIFLPELLVWN